MFIQTAEGKRSIDEDLVICIDRHRNEGERCMVTVYLVSGDLPRNTVPRAIS